MSRERGSPAFSNSASSQCALSLGPRDQPRAEEVEEPQIELPKPQLDFYRLHSLIIASAVSHYRNKVRFKARGNY